MGRASGESPIAPRGSQQLPKGFQALLGPKLSVPQTKAVRGEKIFLDESIGWMLSAQDRERWKTMAQAFARS